VRTLFELLHLYFTAPRLDSAAYQSYQTRLRAILANRDANPETPFWDTLQVTLAQQHRRARPLTPEVLNDLSLERALSFYRERFGDASDFTFAFVGNFSVDSIRPLVLQYIGSLPGNARVEQARDVGLRPPTGVVQKVVRKGSEPKSRTQLIFTGPFNYQREERHALASLIEVLDIRLREVLREDLGGTYGVNTSQSTEREPWANYAVHISFGSAPERLDSLTQAVFAVIEQIKKDGPTATDLAKVQEAQRRNYEKGLQENSFWLQQLLARSQNAEDLRNVLSFPQLVNALSSERVRDAARQYLRTDNYIRISLFPDKT
jgi:zinc protease